MNERGILAWFARNSVASTLLMTLMLVGGVLSLMGTRQEVFPQIDTRTITVSVAYPGAAPEEVERGVCMPVEEAVAGIEGIQHVRSVAQEAFATIVVELEDDAVSRKVLNDVESAVDRITTFAERIEDPVVAEATNQQQVLNVVVRGEVSARTLKAMVEKVRDDLTSLPDISLVTVSGLRHPEISIEVSEETLRKHALSFEQVADAVRRGSQDLPAGSLKTEGGQLLLRTQGQRYTGEAFADLVVLTRPDGSSLLLSDIAVVEDGYEDSDVGMLIDGTPAAMVSVFGAGSQDNLKLADTVKRYVEEVRPTLPAGISISTAFDSSEYLRGRIDLLTEDTIVGAILVFLCLALFMDLHVAFWVTWGIPTAFLGAFCILPYFGVTINMISLFAFLIVLGIVVDDAIVIGENIYMHKQRGEDPLTATIRGVREVAIPVLLGVMTTIVAFLPLLYTAGQMGKIVRQIPLVAVSVLIISTVEGLLVFPAHMVRKRREGKPGPIARVQKWFDTALHRFVNGPYTRTLRRAVRARYVTVALAIGALFVAVGFIVGGHIGFVFFNQMDADHVSIRLAMPQGVPVEQTAGVVHLVEAAAERARQRIDAQRPGEPSIYRHVIAHLGDQPMRRMSRGGSFNPVRSHGTDSHLAEVNIELLPGQERGNLSARDVERLIQEEVGEVPGVSSLVFTSSWFSVGKDVEVELAHADYPTLLLAVDALKHELAGYAGVSGIDDTFESGKQEAKLVGLTPAGEALGLRLTDVGTQVRQGFYGEEVQRFQRGRDEVKVMVRYPQAQRRSAGDIENVRVRLDDGAQVPLATVARWDTGRGYATIHRTDRRRVVSVNADVDESVNNASKLNGELAVSALPRLVARFPGLRFNFEGGQKEQDESLLSMGSNFLIALLAIFALLGFQFRSYLQPLVVMSAIPFGLLGALIGHVIMGLPLSFMSAFGMVALTGVVVNDSLLMIDTLNGLRAQGVPLREAIMQSGVRRFRAILLNSTTTFMGLGPMVLERSLQARFLVPMAVSLAFGVMFATAVTLILVPTLYMVVEDVRAWLGLAGTSQPEEPDPVCT